MRILDRHHALGPHRLWTHARLSEVCTTEIRSAEAGSREVCASEIRAAQIGVFKDGSGEVCATEIGTTEAGAVKEDAAEIRPLEVCALEVRRQDPAPLHRGVDEARFLEIALQDHDTEHCALELCTLKAHAAQRDASDLRALEVCALELCTRSDGA